MSILIKDALIFDSRSTHHSKKVDILIESGKVKSIGKNLKSTGVSKIIDKPNLCVSPGWIDLQAVFCEPGAEHRETISSGQKAAAAGGFTAVCLHGDNHCEISNKSTVEFILNKADKLVNLYPLGAITNKHQGQDLAEMYDMQTAGAIAFSDYKNSLPDSGMMLRALQYSNNINSFVITHCQDKSLSSGGQMNEGPTSTELGLKGIPSISEEIIIERNLAILEYYGGRMHISDISTAKSVELIKKAKSKGLNVTASVSAINLFLDETELKSFDTNYKVIPPLRSAKDRDALRKGIENGTIDSICSDHCPHDPEGKELEFDLAEFGIINIQTFLHCLVNSFPEKSFTKVIDSITHQTRDLLNLEPALIKEDEIANLTIFSLKDTCEYNSSNNYSKSKNSPFIGKPLDGKVYGVINGTKTHFNS